MQNGNSIQKPEYSLHGNLKCRFELRPGKGLKLDFSDLSTRFIQIENQLCIY